MFGKIGRPFLVCLGLVLVASGCSGRKVTTSLEDQSLLQREQEQASSMPGESATSPDTTVMNESIFPSPPSPQTQSGRSQQRSPASPGGPASSQVIGASTLPPGTLGDVFFDFDRAALRPDARATLEANARVLKEKNGVKVLIEGHCDERGTLAYNLVLGERRAQSVKRYLQELGVPVSQLQITSYGKERPFCTEHRETCWQQNRRGHFVAK
jgi:peptidoglycan-associated lipoprotein